jgi:phospholipase/carboxylesterase
MQELLGPNDAKSMSDALDVVVVDTGLGPALTVIWLHGLGADGHDFEPLVAQLGLPFPVRFVLPHAPIRPVSINGGMRMRAWYDIVDLRPGGYEDRVGIYASCSAVAKLVDREIEGGQGPERIVIAGFSQGGAVALQLALREPRSLAGAVGLSTYLPLAGTLMEEASPANRRLPIFLAHGNADPVIPLAFGRATRQRLLTAGYDVEWHEYPMAHGVNLEEIADLAQWLRRRVSE